MKTKENLIMSKNKPTAVPPHEPPKNPEWPSKTGNPSGKGRGNAKSNKGGKA